MAPRPTFKALNCIFHPRDLMLVLIANIMLCQQEQWPVNSVRTAGDHWSPAVRTGHRPQQWSVHVTEPEKRLFFSSLRTDHTR